MAILSTAHLRYSTAEAAENDDGMSESKTLDCVSYGYLFCVLGYPYEARPNEPEELAACANYVGKRLFSASHEGAFYIFFDRDGPEMEGLETYEW